MKKDLFMELIQTLTEYMELLNEELNEIVPIANSCGWKTSRYERGLELRERLAKLKQSIQEENNV